MQINHDGQIDLAIGKSRHEKKWKNQPFYWSDLLIKLSTTHRTAETFKEYLAASKERQSEIKDIGGFVGGYLAQGRRLKGSVNYRSVITLDLDYADTTLWETFTMLYTCASCIYSTHKHSPKEPRLRLIIPLDRAVLPDEYIAISRRIAGNIGIEQFDPTSYQPERLMYWPSTAKDAEYVFEYQDAPWLEADTVLASYRNWSDSSEWPTSKHEDVVMQRTIAKQGDPLEKPGIVGAFCRTYDIHETISKYLGEVYSPCDIPGRYTYLKGSTSGGLITYDDKFAYSHHGTDPISGKLCNAFDLVRIHLFGLRDDGIDEDTHVNNRPSHIAMSDFAAKDSAVMKDILETRLAATADFAHIPADDEDTDSGEEVPLTTDWAKEVTLDVDKKGNILATVDNIVLILENDPYFKKRMALNLLEQRPMAVRKLPWREVVPGSEFLTDTDDACIRHYLEKRFNISNAAKVKDAVRISLARNAFHPVREYLEPLKWDGVKRVDKLLVDYLGAEDSAYTRAVTRKTLVAAVARIFNPGVKFDTVLTLVGPQGVGKSTLVRMLGKQWHSDSFGSIHGKEAFEQVQGVWIVEMAELAGLRKADLESVKHFIAKQVDRYRVSYGVRSENFPRQCIFIATTNVEQFLQDVTGNRRWWPVNTHVNEPEKNTFVDLPDSEIDQIWAEALKYYKSGETLFLPKALEQVAREVQDRHTETDIRVGLVKAYLDKLIPENWQEMDIYERRTYLSGNDPLQPEGTVRRDKVCAAEICCEALQQNIKDLNNTSTRAVNMLMKQIPEWEPRDGLNYGRYYGRQRGYVRIGTAPTTIDPKELKKNLTKN